ncbi:MAG: hypothetical protein GXP27_01885, partial [Planctomycetes bacterium]|nr:hypothetical protein [Planctomycetota bacterium]
MQITRRLLGSPRLRAAGVIVAILAMGIASCRSTHNPRVTKLQDGWPKGHAAFQQTSFVMRKVAIPQVPEAEYVDDVELCMMCHEAYANYMEKNVHRGLREGQSCEACHGPASRHLETRGKEPGLILSFKTLSAREKSAICMKCHEEDDCSPGAQFRASRHAQKGV